MVNSLINKKASPFRSPEWLTIPWSGADKSLEQQVLDQGFEMAYFTERSERLAQLEDGPGKLNELADILSGCMSLHHKLQQLETDIRASPKIEPPILEPLNPRKAREMTIMPTFLGIQLAVMLLGHPLSTKLEEVTKTHPVINNPHLRAVSDGSKTLFNETGCTETAQRILTVTPQLLNSELGLLLASRTIFPLKAAVLQFVTTKSNENVQRCCDLLSQVSSNKGFRFSSHIDLSTVSSTVREEL